MWTKREGAFFFFFLFLFISKAIKFKFEPREEHWDRQSFVRWQW